MAPVEPVPRYHLYGENEQADDFDFFHIETIKARSKPLGWSLDPHSHLHLFQCLIITTGRGRLTDETGIREVHPDMLAYSPPGVVHGWEFTPDTQGYVVSFTQDYLSAATDGQDVAHILAGLGEFNHLTILRSGDLAKALRYVEEMADEFDRGPRRRSVLRSLLTLLLTRTFADQADSGVKERAPGFSLFRFRLLVDQHFRTERAPEFYAAQMGMTPARLNSYCRMFTDRTAAQSIRDRVLMEAKRQLAFSALPVSEIAYDLGYEDPAYFSRIFRKEVGESPQEFRQQQKSA